MRHWWVWLLLAFVGVRGADAHPLMEDLVDVLVERGRIVVEAHVAGDQPLAVGGKLKSEAEAPERTRAHGEYLRDKLFLRADGEMLKGTEAAYTGKAGGLEHYRLVYPTKGEIRHLELWHSWLQEVEGFTATCVVRARTSAETEWRMAVLDAEDKAAFDLTWPAGVAATGEATTRVEVWRTLGSYLGHGVEHILTGYDHLLFVGALALAAVSLWDLVKVVTAFTAAHTATLVLSMTTPLAVSARVVEPMIALSIVVVALQNVFWPERSRGKLRLAVAFGFGLFHGLGFAGGLKEAMAGLPGVGLWAALVGFSVGVEVGHQGVVLPVYAGMRTLKRWGAASPVGWARRAGSAGIAAAGVVYVARAMGGW